MNDTELREKMSKLEGMNEMQLVILTNLEQFMKEQPKLCEGHRQQFDYRIDKVTESVATMRGKRTMLITGLVIIGTALGGVWAWMKGLIG